MVRIRIRGSVPLTSGSGSGSCFFRQWTTRWQQNISIYRSFFAYFFLNVHICTSVFKDKKSKRCHSIVHSVSSFLCLLMEGSASGFSGFVLIMTYPDPQRCYKAWIRFRHTGHCQHRPGFHIRESLADFCVILFFGGLVPFLNLILNIHFVSAYKIYFLTFFETIRNIV